MAIVRSVGATPCFAVLLQSRGGITKHDLDHIANISRCNTRIGQF